MKTAVLPVSEAAAQTLRELTSGGQPVVLLTDPAGAAVAVVVDLDSYEEARALTVMTPVFLVDPSGHQVGVILDAASYQRAEALTLAA